jgi:hypothetical protein
MNTPWKIDERGQHIWKRVYINFPTFLRLEMFHNTGMLCLRFVLDCPLLLSIQLCLWGWIMDCKGLKVAVCKILSGSWEILCFSEIIEYSCSKQSYTCAAFLWHWIIIHYHKCRLEILLCCGIILQQRNLFLTFSGLITKRLYRLLIE